MKKRKKAVKAKPKTLTAAQKRTVAKNAIAQVDAALGVPPKKKPPFPGAEELAGAVFDLRLVLNKSVQKIYDTVLSETIIKLQHARRKNIV